jgi:cyclase
MLNLKFANSLRVFSAVFGFAAMASLSIAQAPAGAPPSETLKPLASNIYYASGSTGSNNGVIIGHHAITVVDTGITTDSEKLELAEIAKVSPEAITTAIVTHSDGDHVNGLAALPSGITIISQENCKNEMEAAANTPPPNAPQPAVKVPLPTKTVATNDSTTIDGIKYQFLHVAPAHTSGDLVVFLPDAKIVFTGDIISGTGPYPTIHLEKNGSSQGWIDTVAAIVALNADTFVPGHGDIQSKSQIQQRLAAVKDRRAQIQTLVAQGKSLDEIKQQLGEATPAGGQRPRFASFTDVVYQELTKKN